MDDRTPDVPETSGSPGEEPPQAPSSASSSTPSPRFDATGVISDEEDIKITDLSKAPPPSTTSTATKSRKRAPCVQRKPGSGKAVDLLAKTPNNLSDHPDPGNSKDLAPKLLTPPPQQATHLHLAWQSS
ncbi:hypothetical protein PtA15_14A121 [Puccinia triticina]|uniref:Uncharacterized protein n=1 Tax=Puccinia triticina TaxID=208348 RepID=A0ABY7D343_9BASI|nr:uncharacterized protein PtA15_14A121 [Puccinia triticina]WAQ91239.1 hypothetical protein PtA15_14A121 [Puccinia triticina]